MTKIMIYAELSNGEVKDSYYELLSKAKEVYKGKDAVFAALLLGDNLQKSIDVLEDSGIDELYYVESPLLEIYQPDYYREAAVKAIEEFDPDTLLICASSIGEELAPSLGHALNTGVAAHCTDIIMTDEGKLAQMVPAFGGKVIGEIFTPDTRPQIATAKAGMFVIEKFDGKECKTVKISTDFLKDIKSNIEVIDEESTESTRIPLDKADIVICGGYGVGNDENWAKLEKLAEMLGGAVGCTRPVVDAGWMEDENAMIGTSGKSIRPKVYIGSGIGGATHHVCGIKDSGVIININSDKEAEIFSVSDYKIVSDANMIIEALLDELAE